MSIIVRFIVITFFVASCLGEEVIESDAVQPIALEELRYFANAFERIRNHYVDPIDDKTLLNYAILGMLKELDPHSNYYTGKKLTNFKKSTTGKYAGIGVNVDVKERELVLVSIVSNGPASKAGLKEGDIIRAIDGVFIKGTPVDDALTRLKGKKGTKIKLYIKRKDNDELFIVTLKREIITAPSVSDYELKDIAYIKIDQFQKDTGKEFVRVINKYLKKKIQPSGYIIDLRYNPGGLVESAIHVASVFVGTKKIVSTKGQNPMSTVSYEGDNAALLKDKPVVILMNAYSASASEIVAGALQDYKQAIIVGETSYGKGSVQHVLPLGEGVAIKLTTARYYTPNGRSIQAVGITPDIFVPSGKITLKEGISFQEKNLIKHISGERKKEKNPEEDVSFYKELAQDLQLYQAFQILRGIKN
jgi:carboxyl-terminal processing protease